MECLESNVIISEVEIRRIKKQKIIKCALFTSNYESNYE